MATQVDCDRCGQLTAYDAAEAFSGPALCPKCTKLDRAPQGEAVRLFEPAPAQITGQMFL